MCILDQVAIVRATNIVIRSKVIIITDGEPTEMGLIAGPDKQDPSTVEEVSIVDKLSLFV